MMKNAFYNPRHFRSDDPAALARVIAATGFGTLITAGVGGLQVTHAPFLLQPAADSGGTTGFGVLQAHVARANDHWRTLDGAESLVIFRGPDFYVSPSWYASKRETGRVVPTWNYVVVHARGIARTFDDPERLRARVEALTDHHESGRSAPWRVDDAPPEYLRQLLGHIVGVDIVLTGLEGKFKLGQNRSEDDRTSLDSALEAERPDVAAALRGLFPGSG